MPRPSPIPRLRSVLCASALAALWLASPVQAGGGFPEPGRDFRAKVSMSMQGGAMPAFRSTGREYYSGGKRRREMNAMGRESVIIERPDLGVVWTLVPHARMVMESPWSAVRGGGEGARDPMTDPDVSVEKLGRERMGSLEVDKYRVKSEESEGTAWVTPDHVPVRFEGTLQGEARGATLEMVWSDHAFGEQDASLFEIPSGYTKMPRMGGRMGGAAPGGQAPDVEALQEALQGMQTPPPGAQP